MRIATARLELRRLNEFKYVVVNRQVNFLPSGFVSNPTYNTDNFGIAQTIYTTPSDSDSSVVRAYVPGLADTAFFKIYGVRYIANLLQPKVVTTDTTYNFFAGFSNAAASSM